MNNGIFARSPELFFSGMLFKRIFLLFLICFPFYLSAQDVSFRHQADKQSYISFQQPASPLSSNGNAMLIKLAAALDANLRHLKIGITFHEIFEGRTPAMKSPEVTIRIQGIRPFLTPGYRGFPMEEMLTPDLLTCNLNLIDLPDSNILRQYRLSNLSVSQLASGYVSTEIPLMQPGKFSITLSDITFHFSDQALERFQNRTGLIDDYYAASALVDSLLESANGYTPLSLHDLPGKYILLMEINRIVSLIRDHRFEEQLLLKEDDPEQFTGKFLQLDKFSRSATMTFEQQIQGPVPIPWGGDLIPLADEYVSHLVSYIHKSKLLNGIRGGIYKEYIDSWFQVSGFANEESNFKELIRKMYPGENPEDYISMIAQTVWDAYLRRTRMMIDSYDYFGAIVLLQHAAAFRDRIPMQLHPDYKPLQVEAIKGIYASYLGIAETCIDLQRFQMAEEYISHAGEYLADYREVIPADTMFQRVFRKLFNRRLQGCDYILAGKQYQEALDCYQIFSLSYPPEMISYVEDHVHSREQQALKGLFFLEKEKTLLLVRQRDPDSALTCYDNACLLGEMITGDPEIQTVIDGLNNRMLPIRYRQLADRATYLYMTYNHEEAYKTFNYLKEIGERLNYPEDTALSRMYIESYKHHMLNELSMATGMIWKDELDQAKEYASEVESVMDLYNLEKDPDLQSALNSYREKIDLKACLGVKEEGDFLAIRAWKNIEMKHFDMAVKQLGEARQKARQHPECVIELQTIDDTIKKYISAAFYQEKQLQASNQVALGNFREAIQRVSDNERFYRNTELEKLGVPFISLLDFVARSSRVPMYLEAISYFLKNGEASSAWICMTWLKRDGVDARDVRDLQELVGSALSKRDFDLFPGSDPEERTKSYAGGNRWFSKFAQAYTDRWQQLQSEQLLKTP
ncbi:MAG: hypothetical protein IH596_05965 [Bacteroidales bacterium]|nr:hypothetical protein [Bacteroidales bacterium]